MHYSDPKVLLVDDDKTTLELIRHGLSANNTCYEVICASSAEQAIGLLERSRFRMVVSDIKMPGMSGLDLLAKIRERWPHVKVILMTGYPSPQLREEIESCGCLRFFNKPILMEELKPLIARELAAPDAGKRGFAGRLTNIRLPDLIQMCCAAGVDTVVQVRKEAAVGTIFIRDGEILHAHCGRLAGVDAFYEILSWQSGSFETLGDAKLPRTTIDHPWQYLLMEGQRRLDEAQAELFSLQPEPHDDPGRPDSLGELLKRPAAAVGDAAACLEPEEREAVSDLSGAAGPSGASAGEAAAAAATPEHVRVLVVDDSALMRHILTNIFSSAPHIEVVGEAENGAAALSMIPDLAPHVVTLDINMPVMDGLTALKHIMIRHPRPTVMCSTLTREGRKMTFDTLKFGAVDFIHKPSNRLASSLEAQYQAIIDKVTLASAVDMDALRFLKTGKNGGAADTAVRPKHLAHVCAVGASEGGYGALLRIVPFLRRDLPVAFLMIIHDDAANVAAFTRYLKHESAIRVQRAVDGAPVKPGVCYVASGAEYMTLSGRGRGYGLRLHDTPFPGRRGGINMLMLSLAEVMKARAAGLILSGGGNDGAEGLREIERRGGFAMVQAPAASLYKEMPRSALKETLQATALPDHAAAKALNRRWGLPGAAPSAC